MENKLINNLYDFQKTLTKEGIFICFSGTVSQDILLGFSSIIENKLEKFENPTKAQNVFVVFVEMVQNMMSYSSDSIFIEENKKECSGVIIVGYDENTKKHFIKSGNTIESKFEEKITKRVNSIKNLSKNDLKDLYKELRKSGENIHKRGAGLGFLEIQRKSSEPLEYSFTNIDDSHSFFCLKSVI